MNNNHKQVKSPGFQYLLPLIFSPPLPLTEPSFEILIYILVEVHAYNDNFSHHLDRPKTNHIASSPLLPESAYKPTCHTDKSRTHYTIYIMKPAVWYEFIAITCIQTAMYYKENSKCK